MSLRAWKARFMHPRVKTKIQIKLALFKIKYQDEIYLITLKQLLYLTRIIC